MKWTPNFIFALAYLDLSSGALCLFRQDNPIYYPARGWYGDTIGKADCLLDCRAGDLRVYRAHLHPGDRIFIISGKPDRKS